MPPSLAHGGFIQPSKPYHLITRRSLAAQPLDEIEVPSREEILKRRALLRYRRKQKRLRNQAKRQPVPIHTVTQRQDFVRHITTNYPLNKITQWIERTQNHIQEFHQNNTKITLYALWEETNPNEPLSRDILRFLLGQEEEDTVSEDSTQLTVSDDSTQPTLVAVDNVWIAAREHAIERDLLWSWYDRQFLSTQSRADRAESREARLKALQTSSTASEAKKLDEYLSETLPPKLYRDLVKAMEAYLDQKAEENDNEAAVEYTATEQLEQLFLAKGKQPGYAMQLFSPVLHRVTHEHYHTVAAALADFFFMRLDHDVLEHDELYTQSQKEWETSLARVVESLQQLELSMLKEEEELAEKERSGNGDNSQRDKRFKCPMHVKLEAYSELEDVEHGHERNEDESYPLLPSKRMVFLDNLPIDITEENIHTLYSRCGTIESIQIFNQRLDLDPGPLNQKQLSLRRKRQIENLSRLYTKWQRPRTPVYALVAFADPEGYRLAVDDALRIFGMLIHKHPVRSIRSSDMTSLYLEDLPDDIVVGDIEAFLNEHFHTYQVTLSSRGFHPSTLVGSCHLHFTSFEDAFAAYHQLQETLQEHFVGVSVQWMQTPPTARDWWTRELSFD